MTSTSEGLFVRSRWLGAVMATGLLALAAAGQAAPQPGQGGLIAEARADLARGDGIAAEIRLKKALAAGAPRDAIAARMGEALLQQGQRGKAREWLGPGKFAPEDAAHGFRMLGLLERLDGNLQASGNAYDRVIALTPNDPQLWVDVGRLRYAGGEHLQAIDAGNYALKLDPANVRALEFRGQLVRDQYGLAAALPWFEAALARAPADAAVLGEYAATLGDLGRAKDMLGATGRLLDHAPGNANGLFLQSVLAARAGDNSLSRSLLNQTGKRLDAVPGRILLEGVLQLRAGNNLLAVEGIDRLALRQPANPVVQQLLARAYYAAGDYKGLIERFGGMAARADATTYMLTLIARAHEVLGQRDQAVALLDRAARAGERAFAPVADNQPIGALLAAQRLDEAEAVAEQMRATSPGSADAQSLAGDVQLMLGRGPAAAERYGLAAQVRMPESLLLKMIAALDMAGQGDAAVNLAEGYLVQNPSSRIAARLAASHAGLQGDWKRAVQLLDFIRRNGSALDIRLLADLSLAQLRSGDAAAAEATAAEAYRLQPANPAAAQAWGMSLAALKQRPGDAKALLDKARAIGGDNPLLAEARRQLAS